MTMRVKDVIRAANPVCETSETLNAAMVKMTESRLGVVTLVDANGAVAGVFTDGDLRRKLQSDGRGILDKTLAAIGFSKTPRHDRSRRAAERRREGVQEARRSTASSWSTARSPSACWTSRTSSSSDCSAKSISRCRATHELRSSGSRSSAACSSRPRQRAARAIARDARARERLGRRVQRGRERRGRRRAPTASPTRWAPTCCAMRCGASTTGYPSPH